MVSFENNYIFIHIPKCAGTSIEEALCDNETQPLDLDRSFLPNSKGIPKSHAPFKKYYEVPQHYTLQTIHDILVDQGHKDFFDNAYIFAVVRDPFVRLCSSASYLSKTFNSQYNVGSLLTYENLGNHRFDIAQYDWLTVNDSLRVNKIIYFESLEEDLKKVSNALNINIDLPNQKLESSNYNVKNLTEYNIRSLVYKKYSKDYMKLNYEYTIKI